MVLNGQDKNFRCDHNANCYCTDLTQELISILKKSRETYSSRAMVLCTSFTRNFRLEMELWDKTSFREDVARKKLLTAKEDLLCVQITGPKIIIRLVQKHQRKPVSSLFFIFQRKSCESRTFWIGSFSTVRWKDAIRPMYKISRTNGQFIKIRKVL